MGDSCKKGTGLAWKVACSTLLGGQSSLCWMPGSEGAGTECSGLLELLTC